MNKLSFPTEISTIIENVHLNYFKENMKVFFEEKKNECSLIKTFYEDRYADGKTLFEKTIICPPDELYTINKLSKELLIDSLYYDDILDLYKEEYKSFASRQIGDISHKDILEYSEFSTYDKIKEKWSSKLLIILLNIKVCPYCNSNFIITLFKEGNGGYFFNKLENLEDISEIEDEISSTSGVQVNIPNATVRAQLDHFFAKNNNAYPFLALSLYNLVPSCMICNSYPLKGSVDFTRKYALNPYQHSIDDYVKFKINGQRNPYEIIMGLKEDFEIDYTFNMYNYNRNITESNESFFQNFVKSCYMLEFFHIINQYSYHKDFIRNQLIKKTVYTQRYLRQLNENFDELNINENLSEDKYEMEHFSNQILGKLLKDIHESFF